MTAGEPESLSRSSVSGKKPTSPKRQARRRANDWADGPNALLARLLSDDPETSARAYEEATTQPLDERWCRSFVVAYMDYTRPHDVRSQFAELLSRFPDDVVTREFSARFQIDTSIIHDAVMEGNTLSLEAAAERVAPEFECNALLKRLVTEYLNEAVRRERHATAYFEHGVDSDAVDWVDDPSVMPESYQVPGTCATCSSFSPVEVGDGGVLGECSKHSAECGMFRQDATCKDWTAADTD